MNNNGLSKYYTDENVVRFIAAQVIVLSLVSLGTHWIWLISLLTVDFGLRAFTLGPSPLAALAKIMVSLFQLKPKPIFAAPKKFAALIGFIFSTIVLLLFLGRFYKVAYFIGGILIVCAILESVFKICLGCYLYDWLVAPVVNRRNNKNQEIEKQR
jgi:hypothetical protein